MASLNTGEMVGLIAADVQENYTGQFETSAINCKINLSQKNCKPRKTATSPYRPFMIFMVKKTRSCARTSCASTKTSKN
jgi:hypothetical protein